MISSMQLSDLVNLWSQNNNRGVKVASIIHRRTGVTRTEVLRERNFLIVFEHYFHATLRVRVYKEKEERKIALTPIEKLAR